MKNKIKEFKELVFAREMSILPGNLAFSFFMAIIPILTLIFYISTQFHLPMDIINNFLSETECEVMEIQFRTAVSIFGEEQVYCFSAMIVYQEKKS